MKYRVLLDLLQQLSNDQLDMDVTVRQGDEFFPVKGFVTLYDSDVLDADHPILKLG